jgi:predicted alpha/beta hydrolase
LSAQWFGDLVHSRATAIVAPGAAAEARFYVPFCEYLATHGIAVLGFDFRTIGESRLAPAIERESGFSAWIGQDFPAVVSHARETRPRHPLVVIGHSAGGWMAGVQPASDRLDAIIGVAALSAYWKHIAWPHRCAHWLAWHALVPAACRLLGFWPGSIGFRRRLGARFGLEFSRWARHPQFVLSEERMRVHARAFRGRLHLFQVSDDPWGTAAAVDAYRDFLPHASTTTIEAITPDHSNGEPVGHFGMFRKAHAEALWPMLLRALDEALAHARAGDPGRSAHAATGRRELRVAHAG